MKIAKINTTQKMKDARYESYLTNEPVKNPKLKPKPGPGPKKPVPGPKRPRPTGPDKVGPFGPKGSPADRNRRKVSPELMKTKQAGVNQKSGKTKPVMPPRRGGR